MEIKKGHRYLCVKTVIMDSNEVAYRKGHVYQSTIDSCITDERGYTYHRWDIDEAVKYFADTYDMPNSGKDVNKWIEETLYAPNESGNPKIDTYTAEELRDVVYIIYKKLNVIGLVEDDRIGRREFSVNSDGYDWLNELGVYARNDKTAIYENVSNIGLATIVLFDKNHENYDENVVSDELIDRRESGLEIGYTLYSECGNYLVGYAYSEDE